MSNLSFRIIQLSLIAIVLFSCKNEPNIPDVSHIASSIKINRFEKDLFAIDTSDVAGGVAALEAKYGDFFKEVYLKIVADLRNPDASAEELVSNIVKNPVLRQLYDTCMVVFPDATIFEKEISTAFQFYQYYFPNDQVPTIYSFISEYSLGSFTYEDKYAGFGWDFFLGSDYPHYEPNYFPDYIKKYMTSDYVVPKLMETIANEKVGEQQGNRMLDYMIHNGKVLYIKDLLLPHVPDSTILEYSAAQTNWVENNEPEMWAHFLKEELIYNTNYRKFQKLVSQSPIAPPGMPQEAPGRAANWVGWQIVKNYMKQNPNMSLADLCKQKDAQVILEGSKYKPRR